MRNNNELCLSDIFSVDKIKYRSKLIENSYLSRYSKAKIEQYLSNNKKEMIIYISNTLLFDCV